MASCANANPDAPNTQAINIDVNAMRFDDMTEPPRLLSKGRSTADQSGPKRSITGESRCKAIDRHPAPPDNGTVIHDQCHRHDILRLCWRQLDWTLSKSWCSPSGRT